MIQCSNIFQTINRILAIKRIIVIELPQNLVTEDQILRKIGTNIISPMFNFTQNLIYIYLDLTFGLVIDGMVLIDQMVMKENYSNQLPADMLKHKKPIYGVLKICRLCCTSIFHIEI